MADEDLRTINELIAIYELEPNIHDIFVEGRRDLLFFRGIFRKIGVKEVIVREISDSIELPNEIEDVAAHLDLNLFNNNRSKVICFAIFLESKLTSYHGVRCIAEKDFDFLLGKNDYECEILLFTDYTCIEMYFFNKVTLIDYFENFLRKIGLPIDLIIQQFVNILTDLFLIRLVNKVLDLNMEWINFKKYWTCNNYQINFRKEEYITAYLSKNNNLSIKSQIFENLKDLKEKLTDDPRYQMHGHDFIDLLRYFNHRCLGKPQKFCDLDIIEGAIFNSFDILNNIEEGLFKSLLKWIDI